MVGSKKIKTKNTLSLVENPSNKNGVRYKNEIWNREFENSFPNLLFSFLEILASHFSFNFLALLD